jgi:Zn-dependent protease
MKEPKRVFNFPSLYQIALVLPAIIIGLTFHEFAHGWMARRLGDRTAEAEGRLTINPLAHIDPIGFIMLLLVGFGWAKPVPVNPYYLNVDAKKGMLLVSIAGPTMNFILAIVAAILYGLLAPVQSNELQLIMQYMIWINIVLAVFNLLPIPPLDGSKVLAGILPGSPEWLYRMEAYGPFLLLALILFGFRFLFLIITPIFELLMLLANFVAHLS